MFSLFCLYSGHKHFVTEYVSCVPERQRRLLLCGVPVSTRRLVASPQVQQIASVVLRLLSRRLRVIVNVLHRMLSGAFSRRGSQRTSSIHELKSQTSEWLSFLKGRSQLPTISCLAVGAAGTFLSGLSLIFFRSTQISYKKTHILLRTVSCHGLHS